MATSATPTRDDFAALLNQSLGGENESFEGRVVTGTVTAIENDLAVIDVGLKSEGRVPLREFAAPGQKAEIAVGDQVEVYVDRIENINGEAMLSRDRARREAAWDKLETEHNEGNRVEGVIFGRVKGGFTVDLGGAVAFLPGSQVDIRPVRDVGPLMDLPQPFQILKMDRRRGNIVVSRRAVLEETRAEQRTGLIQSLHEGQVLLREPLDRDDGLRRRGRRRHPRSSMVSARFAAASANAAWARRSRRIAACASGMSPSSMMIPAGSSSPPARLAGRRLRC